MKPVERKTGFILLTAAGIWIALAGVAAAQNPGAWRKTYDEVLLWVNFAIFVFLILKLLRIPLKKFIADKQNELERKITRLEEEKKEADGKIQEILLAVEGSRAELDSLEQKILEQGERKKEAIITDARRMSRVMLEGAQHRVDGMIRRAKKKLMDELIDAAADLALEKIPHIVTEDDNRKLVQDYIAGAKGK